MTGIIKFIEDVPPFKEGATEQALKEQVLLSVTNKMIENIKANASGMFEKVIDANFISQIFDNYEQEYVNQSIEDMLSSMESRGSDFLFGATSKTKLEAGLKNDDLGYLIKEVNQMVQILKPHTGLDSIAKAASINVKTGKAYFATLQTWFAQQGKEYEEYAKKCQKISDYLNGKVSVESAVEKISGNLNDLVGQALWERVAAQVQLEVLEKKAPEIMKMIRESFTGTNFIISKDAYLKFEVKQTGKNRNSDNRQTVSDSMLTVTLVSANGTVMGTVSFNMSTKYTSANRYDIKPTQGFKERNKVQDLTMTLEEALKAVELNDYWKKRMQPFLKGKENANEASVYTTTSEDSLNWIRTKQLIYSHFLYDVIAIRAAEELGQYADFFSVNSESETIVNLISKYWDYLGDTGTSTLKSAENISNSRKGIAANIFAGHDQYISDQLKVRGKFGEEEAKYESNNKKFWDKKQKINVKISINAINAI